MFDFKKINQKLFGLGLLTTVSFCNTNEVLAKLIKNKNLKNLNQHSKTIQTFEVDRASTSWQQENTLSQNSLSEPESWSSAQYSEGDSFLDFNLTSFGTSNNELDSPQTRFIRTISLAFFVLLFVPFGIFYPFFLFYKKLLNLDVNEDLGDRVLIKSPTYKPESAIPYPSFNLEYEETTPIKSKSQVTVSKLQIACSVNNKDRDVRKELIELCSSVDSRTDEGIRELMQKTISLLVERDEVTHVNCSSKLLELEKAQENFEIISRSENSKIASQDRESEKSNHTNKDSSFYAILTLIFCTSKDIFLPEEITTKKQLADILSEFSEINQDELMKFDLLWNPQPENTYLSNRELLLEYPEMMRLF